MALMPIHFDGYNLRDFTYRINVIDRALFASRSGEMVEIPGRDGAHFIRASSGVREISMGVTYAVTDKADIRKKVDQLAEVLLTDKPAPLIFGDESDLTYYAIVLNDAPFNELARHGKAEFLFVCPDPYKYGQEITKELGVGGTVETVFASQTYYSGTARANPEITVDFTGAASSFTVTNQTTGNFIKIVYGFTAGDVLVVDCDANKVTINGVLQMPTITFDSLFISITDGDIIGVDQPEIATTTMRYRPRWK